MKKLMTPAIVIFVLVLILPSISAAFSGQQEPNKPTLTGPLEVKRFKEYRYTAVTTDPQGDNIYYKFKFFKDNNNNDNLETDWIGPVQSGAEASIPHIFHNKGLYQVSSQAKDTSEHESVWSVVLEVNVEKLIDSCESDLIPDPSETTVSSVTVTISLSGVIVQQITVPVYYNIMNQQQQNPQ